MKRLKLDRIASDICIEEFLGVMEDLGAGKGFQRWDHKWEFKSDNGTMTYLSYWFYKIIIGRQEFIYTKEWNLPPDDKEKRALMYLEIAEYIKGNREP